MSVLYRKKRVGSLLSEVVLNGSAVIMQVQHASRYIGICTARMTNELLEDSIPVLQCEA